ncbi:MAG: DUF2723 domain-containing protein [Labilithrix sp.]|nr:DUF2723 domain-containing protein [Labilithrix sp.]MCW5814025.1 DUF2723 domain-containing protein [Labilithrix sp.]
MLLRRLAQAAVPLASGVAYTLTATREILGGDTGELASAGVSAAVPHPPGYPLFVLWCQAWRWLPAASPAHRVALATAIAGALAIDALVRACRAWGATPIASAIGAAIFAVSPLMWRLSTEPEVFALNVLIVLTLVRIAGPTTLSPMGELRRAWLLALLAGLGIANHHTCVLIAPLGLFSWRRAVRAAPRPLLAVAGSLGALTIGLTPYLFLIVRSRSMPVGSNCDWGDTSTLSGLLHHFLRRDYGTTSLASGDDPHEPFGQLALLGRSSLESGIGPLAVVAALAAAAKRRFSWAFAMLVLSIALAGPLLILRFNLPPRNLMALVVERFHLLPLSLASIVAARGIDVIASGLQSASFRKGVVATSIASIATRGAITLYDVLATHRPTTESYLRNVLAMLPERSILLANGDDVVGGLEYMQCTMRERRDVVVVAPRLLLAEWYARRIEAQLGQPVEHGVVPPRERVPVLSSLRLVSQLLETGRPVYVTSWFARDLDTTFPSYPIGPLIRLTRTPAEVPSPHELMERNEALFAKLTLDATPPAAHTWAGARYQDYARPWFVLSQALATADDMEASGRCRARGAALLPRAR